MGSLIKVDKIQLLGEKVLHCVFYTRNVEVQLAFSWYFIYANRVTSKL